MDTVTVDGIAIPGFNTLDVKVQRRPPKSRLEVLKGFNTLDVKVQRQSHGSSSWCSTVVSIH